MNDELSKALDGAMSDAAEMGEARIESSHPSGVVIWIGDNKVTVNGFEQDRVSRSIVESVNGRAAMAKRIAELEAALDNVRAIDKLTAFGNEDHGLATCGVIADRALTAKGGA